MSLLLVILQKLRFLSEGVVLNFVNNENIQEKLGVHTSKCYSGKRRHSQCVEQHDDSERECWR